MALALTQSLDTLESLSLPTREGTGRRAVISQQGRRGLSGPRSEGL